MFKIKYKFLFIYNVVFNSIGFCLIFPFELSGSPLYWDDVFPVNVETYLEEADTRYEHFKRIEPVIKNSYPARVDWMRAEYELEEARVNKMARASGLSPIEIKCERKNGKTWGQICLEHLILPQHIGISLGGRYEYVREHDWFLWNCYYDSGAYAMYNFQRELNYYSYRTGDKQNISLSREDFVVIMQSSMCLDNAENDSATYLKNRVVDPFFYHNLTEGKLDLISYCGGNYTARSPVLLQGLTRRVCPQTTVTDGLERGIGMLPERLNGYNENAGFGNNIWAEGERSAAISHMFRLNAPSNSRLNLCR